MKKLALLTLAVSQGKTIHNTSKKMSHRKKEYYKEMNKLSKIKNTRDVVNILKKFRMRMPHSKTRRNR